MRIENSFLAIYFFLIHKKPTLNLFQPFLFPFSSSLLLFLLLVLSYVLIEHLLALAKSSFKIFLVSVFYFFYFSLRNRPLVFSDFSQRFLLFFLGLVDQFYLERVEEVHELAFSFFLGFIWIQTFQLIFDQFSIFFFVFSHFLSVLEDIERLLSHTLIKHLHLFNVNQS